MMPRRATGGAAGIVEGIPAMKTIFVMVKCELGQSYKVADEAVQRLEEVSEVHSTSGQYDLLMKCYLADAADIGHFVVEKLQKLPGIKDTFTMTAYKAFSEDKSI
jgi:DNA-binding Lrp family transcriptional regulator